ncbi:MAG: hypothetical protein OEZ51_10785 [Nitrospinota bacterium]|nr:hypothetical protein [Nitrospinota bacterium]
MNIFIHVKKIFISVFMGWVLISGGFGLEVSYGNELSAEKLFPQTTSARLAVEKAWDTYHHAALSGTLPSPMVQTELEMNLHKSRALLAEAYDAEQKGNKERVNQLFKQIIDIAHQVINKSQEPKK